MANDEERHLPPSRKRLRDARKRGQVPRSRDLSAAVGMMAAVGALAMYGGDAMRSLMTMLSSALGGLDRFAKVETTAELLSDTIVSGGWVLVAVSGPVALAVMVGTVATATAQGGLVIATEALGFHPERLNPANGFKKLGPSQGGLDSLKALLATAALGGVVWQLVAEIAMDAPRLVASGTEGTVTRAWELLLRLLWRAVVVLVGLGAADYFLQRHRVLSPMKMTRQEAQEEHKADEGSAEVKAKMRRLRKDMLSQRMLRATEKATVVITNPTHYAVALEYNREKSAAPIVVAKGRDLVALKIREIARLHGVPIVENPPLARALHGGAEVGDMIPAPLFGAVAEVLAYLVRIRQLML